MVDLPHAIDFVGGEVNYLRHIHLLSWEKVCRPKIEEDITEAADVSKVYL